ncbi:MAG: hypothetical protein KDK39_13175 [Leptospiraceae bacterium]|nr:hypothetical protein [Leptospiraceae bacterium]
MWIAYRIIIILAASSLVGWVTWLETANDLTAPALMGGLTALVSGIILFLDRIIRPIDADHLLYTTTGVFLGLMAGFFLQQFVDATGLGTPGLVPAVYILPVVFFGWVGAHFSGFSVKNMNPSSDRPEFQARKSRAKLLDTSVIIDGRILDIAETSFIEGPFIIPNFVLREIQLISDSSDPIKRNRGRRGLEMLNKLQESKKLEVKISYLDYTDTREVDQKLVKASIETGAQLITNDFNLNQVASLQGVEVLNLNTLTTALKPVVLPGEEIIIEIIKEGKDDNQGIGYLEDGTMVVVENGGNLLAKKVRVSVTSIIQTAAGKMIFTRSEGVVEDKADSDSASAGSSGGRGGRRRRSNRGGGRSQQSRNTGNSQSRREDYRPDADGPGHHHRKSNDET